MGKSKADGKPKGKGSQLLIRIDKSERAAFVSLCEELDTSAAREIRRFMRGFVATHAKKLSASDAAVADARPTDAPVAAPPLAVAATETAAAESGAATVATAVAESKGPRRTRSAKP